MGAETIVTDIQGGKFQIDLVRPGMYDFTLFDYDPDANAEKYYGSVAIGALGFPESLPLDDLPEGITSEMVDTEESFMETIAELSVLQVCELLRIAQESES